MQILIKRYFMMNHHIIQELCPLISYALCIQSKLCFRAISKQLLTGFQWNFVGTFNTEKRWTYHLHVRVGSFNSELCPLICYALCNYVYRVDFVSTIFLGNCLLEFYKTYGIHQYQEEIWSYAPWLIMKYVYRVTFVTAIY